MSKIEVNEYVRINGGEIGIFKGYNNNKNSQWKYKVKLPKMKLWKYYEEENIVKHSKQLIDLIEVGDFVNGYKVISVDYDVMNDTTECIELDLNSNYQYNFISIRQIKTILTKEQYMPNCYKVVVGEEWD